MIEARHESQVDATRRRFGWQILTSLLFALLGTSLLRCACGYTHIEALVVTIPTTMWALWALHHLAPRQNVAEFFWAIPAGLVAFLSAENLLYVFWFGHDPLFEFWDDDVKLTLASILRIAGVVLLVAGFVIAVVLDMRAHGDPERG
jgi:hypothetical protein